MPDKPIGGINGLPVQATFNPLQVTAVSNNDASGQAFQMSNALFTWDAVLGNDEVTNKMPTFDNPQAQVLPPPGPLTYEWMRNMPIVQAGVGVSPVQWHWNQYSETNFAGGAVDKGNNEVMNFGWNLSAGGGQVVAGRAGIGTSYESNYDPLGIFGGPLVEFHDFYIKPTGVQQRIKSYTIDTNTGSILLYFTAGLVDIRNPDNDNRGFTWQTAGHVGTFRVWDSSTTTDFAEISADFTNPVLAIMYIGNFNYGGTDSLIRFTCTNIQSPGLNWGAGFWQYLGSPTGLIIPDIDDGIQFGRSDLRWSHVVAVNAVFNTQDYFIGAAPPTLAEIPDGAFQVWYDSVSTLSFLYMNVSGVLRSVAII